jgi:hypothetical protein
MIYLLGIALGCAIFWIIREDMAIKAENACRRNSDELFKELKSEINQKP